MPMIRTRLLLPLLLLGSAAAIAAPEAIPPEQTAEYTVHANGFKVGEMTRRFYREDGGDYVLETDVRTTGFISLFKDDRFIERSRFQLLDGFPRSSEYLYQHNNSKSKTLESLSFDWETREVTSVYKKRTEVQPLNDDVMDKLNYQIALAQDVATGKRDILYRVADRGDIRDYRFIVHGEETVVTDLGKYQAIKVERISHSPTRKTFIWFAPALHYQVVKLEQNDDGDEFATYLTHLTF